MWISSGRDPVVEQHEGKTLLQQRWTAEVARALLVDGVSAVVVDEEVFAVRGTPEIGPWPGLSHGVLGVHLHPVRIAPQRARVVLPRLPRRRGLSVTSECVGRAMVDVAHAADASRERERSEEHTTELQSLMR